ncbi:MAG: uroporphyrinogen decarboxylase family protein [Phycisphaerae bacterium]|nr:uroporphyrinogen decarboxylase family protein [Phycisphaerae bacterium]
MNDLQNALEILRFGKPERVLGGIPTFDCNYYGVNHEPYGGGPGGHDSPIGTQWHDIWGVGWQKQLDGVMGFAIEHPLADLARGGLARFRFPDPDDERLCGRIYQRAKQAREEGAADTMFLAGGHRETLWERCYNLVGMDNLMMAFIDAPEAVRELLHRVMDFQLGMARHYLSVGIGCSRLGDDLGTQISLLFSRDILEEFFVPEYRRLTSLYRDRGVIISFHSCGHVEPIVDVFMDIGVNILNPVQATANDVCRIRAATQGRMALQGGVSTHTIMTGPIDAIVRETRLRLWQLGRSGGYFCGPDQGMPFPKANYEAFAATLEEFGQYPLQPPPEQ